MLIEQNAGLTILTAEGNNRICDRKKMNYFVEKIYLGVKDDINNYIEVSPDIWQNPLSVIKREDIDNLQSNFSKLEDFSLDADFRILILELKADGFM